MDQQLSFFSESESLPDNRSLFIALLPDSVTTEKMGNLVTGLQGQNDLRGVRRPTKNLHVTLQKLGGWSDRIIRSAGRAASSTAQRFPPFEICLDRVAAWGNGAFVLKDGDDGNPQLRKFRRELITDLAREIGLKNVDRQFNPHVTLLYGNNEFPETPVEPVGWTAAEVVLICSHEGKSHYEALGRWPLEGEAGDGTR